MEQLSLFGAKEKSTDWKWWYKDYPPKNGLKVFSCFACGGGSTMGYKLAGCDVLGCVEIDKRMNDVYINNHHPQFNYLMDIREFNKLDDLPYELYNLDILDGSPPCTTFSISGEREKNWGKAKKFREGQAEQTLDDLSFVFIDTVKKLRPKCVIMENVEGLIQGDAWSYVQRIYQQMDDIGYDMKHWLVKSETMGVPQKRHRVIFLAFKKELNFDFDKFDMFFDYERVEFGKIKAGEPTPGSATVTELINKAKPTDKALGDVILREHGKWSRFNEKIVWDDDICPTIISHGMYRGNDNKKFTMEDYRNAQTFPQDYDFENQNPAYICGMSVPPIMIKRIVNRIIETGVFKK